jgi:hypothetical protein
MSAKKKQKTVENVEVIKTQPDGVYRLASRKVSFHLSRYTAFVTWEEDEEEELDIDAISREEAREVAKLALAKDYNAGWKKIEIVGARVGHYI